MAKILSSTCNNIGVLEKAMHSFRSLAVTIRSTVFSLCARPDSGILEGVRFPHQSPAMIPVCMKKAKKSGFLKRKPLFSSPDLNQVLILNQVLVFNPVLILNSSKSSIMYSQSVF